MIDSESEKSMDQENTEVRELREEVERLKANYKVALDEIDNLMLHYATILPPAMRDRMRRVQTLVRGLS